MGCRWLSDGRCRWPKSNEQRFKDQAHELIGRWRRPNRTLAFQWLKVFFRKTP
ncbi:hypothetical protein PVAP13_1KG121477 [Panicum virgatum]|uniref:Uncharacterized protein n=1 Tax=Panicum virgatum TaxID=38727 RepID=A0A8T0XNA6_PANVG|nr:hypothetical protein PVAP13_1KG121477 [Panicum virgatum]